MSKHLQRDLDNLQRDLLALAASAEEAVHKAIRALQDREVRRAQEVIDGDSEIDREENLVEEECLKVLALHQPVAVDLRRITAALKINAELERMADLAEDIAERAIHLARPPFIPVPDKLQRMTDLTTSMEVVKSVMRCSLSGTGMKGGRARWMARSAISSARSAMRSNSALILSAAVIRRRSTATGWCRARTLRHSSSTRFSSRSISESPSMTSWARRTSRSWSARIALWTASSAEAARARRSRCKLSRS